MSLEDNYFQNIEKPHIVTAEELDKIVNKANANESKITTTHTHNGVNSPKIDEIVNINLSRSLVSGQAHTIKFYNPFVTPSLVRYSIYLTDRAGFTTTTSGTTITVPSVYTGITITDAGSSHTHTMASHTHTTNIAHTHTLSSLSHTHNVYHYHYLDLQGGLDLGDTIVRCTAEGTNSKIGYNGGGSRTVNWDGNSGGVRPNDFNTGVPQSFSPAVDSGGGSPISGGPSTNITGAESSHTHPVTDVQHTHNISPNPHTHTIASELMTGPHGASVNIDGNALVVGENQLAGSESWFGVGSHTINVTPTSDCDIQIDIWIKGQIA